MQCMRLFQGDLTPHPAAVLLYLPDDNDQDDAEHHKSASKCNDQDDHWHCQPTLIQAPPAPVLNHKDAMEACRALLKRPS